MDKKYCFKCGQEIHPQRLKILPKTNSCVNCSTSGKYMGTPIQQGEGDHTYNELLIQGSRNSKIH